jgi:hypothetical protein
MQGPSRPTRLQLQATRERCVSSCSSSWRLFIAAARRRCAPACCPKVSAQAVLSHQYEGIERYLRPIVRPPRFWCHRPMPEPRIAMHEVQPRPANERPGALGPVRTAPISIAESELRAFIDSVTDLFGPDQTRVLTDIWLDALASMDRMPGPTSRDWRLVTLVASARLAGRLCDLSCRSALF